MSKLIQITTAARAAGEQAAREGKPRTACPAPHCTPSGMAWLAGWDAAQAPEDIQQVWERLVDRMPIVRRAAGGEWKEIAREEAEPAEKRQAQQDMK